jgi:hypothetical protein
MNTSADGADKPLGCEFRREKCTRQERQVLATLAALALISTVCRSFPKISSALSAKVCGRSRSAKIIDKRVRRASHSTRETGALGMYGRGSRGPTRHVCSICSVVCTRDRVAGAGYACNARPDLHTVCRSFPKISSALSAKVCGGSRSAKILIQALSDRPFGNANGARRGPWACTGGGRASRRSVVCTRDRVAGAGYACNARPDLHTVCRSFQSLWPAFSANLGNH